MTFARAVISRPRLLIASYPSRGLDIATVHAVHKTLFRLKKQGVGTILISEDISELFTMCDRILVLYNRTVNKELSGREIESEEVLHHAIQGL